MSQFLCDNEAENCLELSTPQPESRWRQQLKFLGVAVIRFAHFFDLVIDLRVRGTKPLIRLTYLNQGSCRRVRLRIKIKNTMILQIF